MIRVAESVNPNKYGRLLSKTLPTVIKTEAENDRAILLVEKLLEKGDKISPEENALLDLLWNLIADFEERFYQPRDASPQEVLIEMMNARDLKQKDLIEVFGSKSRVSEAVSGKREITKLQAKALAEFFKVSVELFI
ncbi:MAG: helix-turn-helix domain-containing protein [Acidobacteriota bacterium]